jgi:hypothetical protein
MEECLSKYKKSWCIRVDPDQVLIAFLEVVRLK